MRADGDSGVIIFAVYVHLDDPVGEWGRFLTRLLDNTVPWLLAGRPPAFPAGFHAGYAADLDTVETHLGLSRAIRDYAEEHDAPLPALKKLVPAVAEIWNRTKGAGAHEAMCTRLGLSLSRARARSPLGFGASVSCAY